MPKLSDNVIRPILNAMDDVPIKARKLSGAPDKLKSKQNQNRDGVKDTDKFNDNTNKPNKPDQPNKPGSNQPYRDENGRFARDPDLPPRDSTYDRPSGWRAGMRDKVWLNAQSSQDGLVRDPVPNGVVMNKDDDWIMGHAPGYEFRHHQRSAQERGISRQEFLDEYYGMIEHLRPETPGTSSGHGHELPWENYKGPGSAGYGE